MSTRHRADPAPQDPGLQAERTRLAWQRTALAMGVCAALVLRLGIETGAVLSFVQAALLGAATILLLGIGVIRERQLAHGGKRNPQTAPRRHVMAIAASSAILAALGTGWIILR